MADPKKVVGAAVRGRRLALGLSQEKLAEIADLHRTYVGQLERGETNVSLLNLLRIAKALHVRIRDLVENVH